MATLTTINPVIVKGPVADRVTKYILNGQSWNKGQLLYESTGGLLTACASDAVNIKYQALETVADPGNSTTTANVITLTRDHVLHFSELNGAVVIANIGQQYGIDVTSNVCTLDLAETSAKALEIVELPEDEVPHDPNAVAGTVSPRVACKILTTVLEAAPA